jgi:hypothetical protein
MKGLHQVETVLKKPTCTDPLCPKVLCSPKGIEDVAGLIQICGSRGVSIQELDARYITNGRPFIKTSASTVLSSKDNVKSNLELTFGHLLRNLE